MVHTYLRTYLHFNVCYPSEPGLAGLISVFFLHLFQKDALGISGRDCYRLNALPIVQPTVSKHRRKLKAQTETSGLASSFLHPPPDSWWQRHHLLFHPNTCQHPQVLIWEAEPFLDQENSLGWMPFMNSTPDITTQPLAVPCKSCRSIHKLYTVKEEI